MRFLAMIFSVIVMTLTVVPCCAYDNCSEEIAHNDTGTKSEIPCSPFVHCSCSSVIGITPSFRIEFVQETQPIKKETQYNKVFTPGYFSSIWQPPKAC